MRITAGQLKRLVDSRIKRALAEGKHRNRSIIFEADEPPQLPENPALKPELGDSIDAQIDKKFIEYEDGAKTSQNEGVDFRAMAYRILFEADEEDSPGEGDDEGGDEDLADALGGGAEGEETEPAERMTVNDVDIYEFASNVARLIDNVENLLEFRDTIMKRSMNFLKKSYDATVLEQYEQIMESQFDIVIGQSDVDKEFEITPPPAVGAGVPPGA